MKYLRLFNEGSEYTDNVDMVGDIELPIVSVCGYDGDNSIIFYDKNPVREARFFINEIGEPIFETKNNIKRVYVNDELIYENNINYKQEQVIKTSDVFITDDTVLFSPDKIIYSYKSSFVQVAIDSELQDTDKLLIWIGSPTDGCDYNFIDISALTDLVSASKKSILLAIEGIDEILANGAVFQIFRNEQPLDTHLSWDGTPFIKNDIFDISNDTFNNIAFNPNGIILYAIFETYDNVEIENLHLVVNDSDSGITVTQLDDFQTAIIGNKIVVKINEECLNNRIFGLTYSNNSDNVEILNSKLTVISSIKETLELDSPITTDITGEIKVTYEVKNRFEPIQFNSRNLIDISKDALKYNTYVQDSAFDECENLKKIKLSDRTLSIGKHAFHNCRNLEEIDLGEKVIEIAMYAFNSCSKLKNIKLPETLKTLGKGAFYNCPSLTDLYIPSNLESIYTGCFDNCVFNTIKVSPNNTVFDSRNNCNAIIESSSNTIIKGSNNTIIPNTITTISDRAFHNCKGITSLTIPDSVTSIGEGAFAVCSNLRELILPQNLVSVDESSFSSCTSLTRIEMPKFVKIIYEDCFCGCTSLKTVILGENISKLYEGCFQRCTSLTDITCAAKNTPSLDTDVFTGLPENGILRIPSGSDYSSWLSALPSGWTIEYI
jgi:hypothetical protein